MKSSLGLRDVYTVNKSVKSVAIEVLNFRLLLRRGRTAEYFDDRVTLFMCLSVCSSGCFRRHMPDLYQIFVHVCTCYLWPLSRFSSGDVTIRYVLPILWTRHVYP